jgi:hypothetical protein
MRCGFSEKIAQLVKLENLEILDLLQTMIFECKASDIKEHILRPRDGQSTGSSAYLKCRSDMQQSVS